jgi:hypothetical protein
MVLSGFQVIAQVFPAAALRTGLAEFGPNQIVSMLLMTAGVLMLGLALRRTPVAPPTTPVAPPSQSPATSLEPVLRDAEELAALLASQMDRQTARLERLIAEADDRIKRLERLAAAAEAPSVQRLHPDSADPLNRRIYDLADEGLPPVEIARALSQQTGKIELILALRQRA